MLSCLIAAALWAVALSLFRDPIRRIGTDTVNLFKCTVGGAAFLMAAWRLPGTGLPASHDSTWLALSGVVGMAIGDVLLFVAVREIGVQRALILFNAAPVITGLAATWLYGEHLTALKWTGIGVILAGITLVETDPHRQAVVFEGQSGLAFRGVLAGLGAAAGQSAGILLAHGPLRRVDLLPASGLRLAAAAVALAVFMLLHRRGRERLARLRPSSWPRLALPTLLGTVIAIYFMMRGIRDVPAGIAAALLATTPIFALPITRFFLAEGIGPRSVAGTLLSVAGVVLLGAF
ncbi:MAG: DMT family transporter [Acidobacteriota bacterium]|nr:DMT family transporter [Acidobacteriota bacterium]MDQ7088339.1 DMT family transporter [Acidobacteriota bacterium]